MRVLITGASGYIGAVMTPLLMSAGHEVEPFDLGLYADAGFPGESLSADGRDIRNVTVDDLEGFEAVIALAALSNDPLGNLNPNLTYAINHQANVRLARLAKAAGVQRFLFASSCSLYGAAGGHLVDESASFAPVTPYGRSKVLVEEDLRGLADDDFSPTFLRNATVYGVSPALRLDIVVNNLTAWAVATGRIVLVSDGTPWRPQVYVGDVCTACVAILEAPRHLVHDEAFNIGRTDQNFQVRDLAEMVAEAVPGAMLEIPESVDPDTRSYKVDFSKFASVFPQVKLTMDVPDGIAELVTAFEQAGLGEADFARYTRLSEIRRRVELGELSEDLRWR